MQYVICYDISDDRRRNRVATLLLDFGSRAKESVFIANLDSELAERMRARLASAVDPDWDRLHVFELCGACEKRTWTLGQGQAVQDPEWYIV